MGALDLQCALHGIPCIMAELGSGNRVLWENVDLAKKGIINCLHYLKMLEGEVKTFHGQKIITKRKFPCTHRGGLVIPQVQAGCVAKAGTLIANVLNYVGDVVEEIRYDEDVCIFAVAENPISSSGRIVAALGTEWEEINLSLIHISPEILPVQGRW